MKPRHTILAMAVAVGAAGPPVMATAAPPMPAPPTTAPAAVQVDPLVQAIRQAPDPSSVTQAYANAHAANRDDLDLERAYVARMAELGLPEMADAQAQDLLRRDPNNGLAWSVAAYTNAKRGQISTALTSMAVAVRLSPDDPFVQRTAGQLVAWYDTKAGQQQVDDSARKAVETLRTNLAGRAMYVDAYRTARETYAKEYASATTQPSAEPGAVATAGGQAYPSSTPVPGAYNTYYSYPEPYAYTTAPYYYPAPYYPGPYYGPWWPDGGAWWWPTFSFGFIFTNNDFNNHHDGDHHHHNDFNHHNGQFHHGDFHDPPTRQAPPPRPADPRGSSMASHSVVRPPAASGGAGAVPQAAASARPTGAPRAAASARPTGAPRAAAPARPTGAPHAVAAPHASPAGGMHSAPASGGHGGAMSMGRGGGGGGMGHGGGGGGGRGGGGRH